MKSILSIFTLKRSFILTIGILPVLIVFSFYGLYTNSFYFFKIANYIFPILTVVHFIYLYVLWFKIKEDELTDPKMRNLEYLLYGVLLFYIYKTIKSFALLLSYYDYEVYELPGAFLPLGILIFSLHLILVFLTFILFFHRKVHVGDYRFENRNHIDSW